MKFGGAMTHSTMRSLVLIGTLIGGAGLAWADQPPDAKSTDAPPATRSPETIKKARAGGLKPEVRNGVTVFCWEDADIGTRFKTKKCVDEGRLDEILALRQAQRDALNRGGGNYGTAK